MTLEERIKEAITIVPDFPKAGIQYKDITTLFQNAGLCQDILDTLVEEYQGKGLEAIIGLESRGFMFGFALALRLKVPFILIRKKGKLPRLTYEVKYSLEYGENAMEMHVDAIAPGSKVLIHDDLLATGGTAEAAAELVKDAGGVLVGFSFIIELSYLSGRKKLSTISPVISTFATY